MPLPAIPLLVGAAKVAAGFGGRQILKHVGTAGVKAGVRGAAKLAASNPAFTSMAGKSIAAAGAKGFGAVNSLVGAGKAIAGGGATAAGGALANKIYDKIKGPKRVEHKKPAGERRIQWDYKRPTNKLPQKHQMAPGAAILHQSGAFKDKDKAQQSVITQMTGAKHPMRPRPTMLPGKPRPTPRPRPR